MALLLLAGTAAGGDQAVELAQPVIAIRLLYTGQGERGGDYYVVGFNGCATPGAQLEWRSDVGPWHQATTVTEDGSFRLEVPYASATGRLQLRATHARAKSEPVELRPDHPLTGGMFLGPNERGWNNITTRSQLQAHRQAWTALHDPVQRRERAARRLAWIKEVGTTLAAVHKGEVAMPDSLVDPEVPVSRHGTAEDLVVYGYAPSGDRATCIVGASGFAADAPIDDEGRFEIILPQETVRRADNGLPAFLINVTTTDNRLLSAHAWGGLPMWTRNR